MLTNIEHFLLKKKRNRSILINNTKTAQEFNLLRGKAFKFLMCIPHGGCSSIISIYIYRVGIPI